MMTLAATTTTFDVQPFRPFHEIDPFPIGDHMVVRYFELTCCFSVTEFLPHHGFYHHFLKLSCVPFIRYSLRHSKTPHFLVQV